MAAAKEKSGRGFVLAQLAAAAVATVYLFGDVAPAFAQEQRRTLFDYIFGPREERRPRGEIPETRTPEKSRRPNRQQSRPRNSASQAAPAEVKPEVAKADDAKVVLVLGDFLGSGLAEGLTAAYAETPGVRVVEKTNGSSGIVRDDFYNWPTEVAPILEAQKPAAVVIMIGTNDRQEMRVDGQRAAVRTTEWSKEYEKRVANLARAVTDKSIPLVWVGMPPFRQSSMSSDMLALNDVYRSASEAAGGSFVDIWEGFVDENGAFVMTGPDIKGNAVRLRSGDNGLSLTSAGKRKVAFYAEKSLEKILGTQHQQLIGAATPSAGTPAEPGSTEPIKLDRTNPISLADPELDGPSELLGANFKAVSEARTPAEKLSIEGIAPRPVAGRADDFGDGEPARAAAPPPTSPEQTTAIRPKPQG
ncbi:MAG: DUF459 domain-containing protein [Mesorhizobium sp.]